MLNNKKIVVVLPAYNAAKTLFRTWQDIPHQIVDEIVLVDDYSDDNTMEIAEKIGIRHIIRHEKNLGYGGNQKSCYKKALELNADIIIMLHPDYQYTPRLITAMSDIIASGLYQVVFASRILGKGAIKGGMPIYKYFANRLLTFIQNLLMFQKLSEYHTGYRAYSSRIFNNINWQNNSDNYIFDNQICAQIFNAGFDIAEITCPTSYFKEASSINLSRSLIYGFGVIWVSFQYFLNKIGLYHFKLFKKGS